MRFRLAWHDRDWFGRLLAIGLVLVPALAAICFAVACFLPVYTDELLWKMSQDRLGFDHGQNVSAYLTCGQFSVPVPAVLLPFRWLETWIYEPVGNPLVLRAIGVALALAWLGVTWLLLRHGRPRTGRRIGTLLLLSFATIGVMPFLLVLNRPELILLFGLSVFSLPLILGIAPRATTLAQDVLLGLAAAAGGGVIMTCHPRAFLLWPLAAMTTLRFVRRRAVAVPVIAVLAVVALANVQNMGMRTACSDPHLAPILLRDSLLAALAAGQLKSYALSLIGTALAFPGNAVFLDEFQFRTEYRSYILPAVTGGFALFLARVTVYGFGILLVFGAWAYGLKARRAWRHGPGRTGLAALGFLWFFWAFSVVARVYKNDYEATLLMPVIVFMTVGSIWIARDELARGDAKLWAVTWRGGIMAIAVLSVVSQVALLNAFVPRLWSDWTTPGYPPGQRFSVVGIGYSRLQPLIEQAGAQCGIKPDDRRQHLIVDELTYYVFRKSYEPFLATFLDQNGWGRDITDFRAILAHVGSQGMVVGCQWVPDSLRKDEKRSGAFCCVPATAWQ